MLTKNLIEFSEREEAYTVQNYGDTYAQNADVEIVVEAMKASGEIVSRVVEQQSPTTFIVTTEYRDLDAYVAYMSNPAIQLMVEWIATNTKVSSLS